jgi:hypothetical protein
MLHAKAEATTLIYHVLTHTSNVFVTCSLAICSVAAVVLILDALDRYLAARNTV